MTFLPWYAPAYYVKNAIRDAVDIAGGSVTSSSFENLQRLYDGRNSVASVSTSQYPDQKIEIDRGPDSAYPGGVRYPLSRAMFASGNTLLGGVQFSASPTGPGFSDWESLGSAVSFDGSGVAVAGQMGSPDDAKNSYRYVRLKIWYSGYDWAISELTLTPGIFFDRGPDVGWTTEQVDTVVIDSFSSGVVSAYSAGPQRKRFVFSYQRLTGDDYNRAEEILSNGIGKVWMLPPWQFNQEDGFPNTDNVYWMQPVTSSDSSSDSPAQAQNEPSISLSMELLEVGSA